MTTKADVEKNDSVTVSTTPEVDQARAPRRTLFPDENRVSVSLITALGIVLLDVGLAGTGGRVGARSRSRRYRRSSERT